MAGYVGNLISYRDRREGELSAPGIDKPEQVLMGPGPGVMESVADRWVRRQASLRSARIRDLAVLLPGKSYVKYKGQKMYYDKSSHS